MRDGREEEEEGSAGLTLFAACHSNVLSVPAIPAAWNTVWKPE